MTLKELLLEESELSRCARTISESICEAVNTSHCKGVVLGISGGVDSSLVLSLACRAKVDVHAMILPESPGTGASDVEDAKALAKKLGVPYSVVYIGPILETLDKGFPWKDYPADRKRLALGNAKARLRMVCNYMAANLGERLVLGTGNRTEILLGYATKYGDGGVDMQPIGDLYKAQVRQLAAYVGVPEKIVNKVPTAGLWPGQTDEGELGASYDVMDEVLYYLADKQLTVRQAAEKTGNDLALVKKLYDRMQTNAHKRCMPPVTKLFDKR